MILLVKLEEEVLGRQEVRHVVMAHPDVLDLAARLLFSP
jgi:hypothetical protein